MTTTTPTKHIPSRRSLILFGAATLALTLFTRFGLGYVFSGQAVWIALVFFELGGIALCICTAIWLFRTWPAYRAVWIAAGLVLLWCVSQHAGYVFFLLWGFGVIR